MLEQSEDVRVFIALQHKQGNRKRKFGSKDKRNYSLEKERKFTERDEQKANEVAQIVDEIIGEEYLSEERPTVEAVYDSIEARLRLKNKGRDEDEKLPIPVKSSVYEIVNKLPEYEKDRARYGQRYADRMHRAVKQGPRPERPLERAEMDDTKVDLLVIDTELGLPIGRPTIFSNIDIFSKMPLGIYSSFNAPGYVSTMRCLMHSIKKKRYVKNLYPEIENEWGCYGIPEVLVVDNAKHYWSESLEDAALELNMLIDFSPVKMPWYKAGIERFQGITNRQLSHHQPGTSFSNIFDRGDYDPGKHALVSYETYLKILHIYLIDVYSQEEHDFDGFPDIPARRWSEGIRDFPPALPSKAEDLRVLIGQVEWRVISPNGIELFGLHYNCDDLISLREQLKGAKAKIKLDPDDISICYAADTANGRYIPVPAKNQEYTKGLTLFQHDVIRRYARQMVKKYVDAEALCRARELIKEIVWQEWEQTKRSDTRVRMARFMNYGWQARGESFESEGERTRSGEQRSEAIAPADDLPRLSPATSTDADSSDLGSAFPSQEPTSDSLAEPNNQSTYRVTENPPTTDGKNGNHLKSTKTSGPLESETSATRTKNHSVEVQPSANDSQDSETTIPDRGGWSAEYE